MQPTKMLEDYPLQFEATPPIPYWLIFIARLVKSYTREVKFCFHCTVGKARISLCWPSHPTKFQKCGNVQMYSLKKALLGGMRV